MTFPMSCRLCNHGILLMMLQLLLSLHALIYRRHPMSSNARVRDLFTAHTAAKYLYFRTSRIALDVPPLFVVCFIIAVYCAAAGVSLELLDHVARPRDWT